MSKAADLRPRDLVSPWPGGKLKRGADPIWGERALDQALIVRKVRERLERNGAKLEYVAARTAISKSTLNRFLTGESWPTLYVATSLARSLAFPELWNEVSEFTRDSLT